MSYKIKLKIKIFGYSLLGILTLITILTLSWFFDRFIEMILVIVCFYIFRPLFDKQYHSKTLIKCSIVSVIVFTIISNIVVEKSISILYAVTLSFFITLVSYYVKDYIDNTILLKQYEKKLSELNTKSIYNLTEEEMYNILNKVRPEVIHIVYGYLHKPPNINAQIYAYNNNISEATLYRYVKIVRDSYVSLLS